ncbi:MAG: hypothetical protein ACKN9T_00120 [Candidatus Methylumidiphilus sp.]
MGTLQGWRLAVNAGLGLAHGAFLSGSAAVINAAGNLGGYFAPVILGWLLHRSGTLAVGPWRLALVPGLGQARRKR